jgi:predicted TIM-barrel fold metal-dependent hydrolase
MIIDFHTYVGRSIFADGIESNELLETMDKSQVDAAVICPVKTVDAYFKSQNEYIARLQEENPGKFFGFARIDPNLGEKSIEILKDAIENLKLKGLVLHPWEETFAINDKRVFPFMQIAEDYNIPVMIETGYPWLSHCLQVGDLAARYKNVKIIMTHGGQIDSSGFSLTDADYVMKLYSNLIIDTAGVYADELIENTASLLGSDRILFGSHAPWLNMQLELVRVKRTHIPEELKNKILYENACNILGLNTI